jgi:hypothetical protein
VVYHPSTYPSDARVGFLGLGGKGRIETGITPDNLLPWCIAIQSEGDEQRYAAKEQEYQTCLAQGTPQDCKPPPPRCPADFELTQRMSEDDQLAWTTRGAMNAGFAVFVYLDHMIRGNRPAIHYDECERLAP